ncbi:MAG TPA: calcium-binding protein [Pirellulaceae bacterium]|nr:calcium-binding protein [Pirellulaceae bacterium]HMO93791.1 calcium-binding protein [Pirellulaceae bacterium]HMP70615.1 calcium-binding protein [Pirellulaceae bacterium]
MHGGSLNPWDYHSQGLALSGLHGVGAMLSSAAPSAFDESLIQSMQQSMIHYDASAKSVTIQGTGGNDHARVSVLTNGQIRVRVFNVEWRDFNRSLIREVVFFGRNGDDIFENYTDIPSTAYGHAGNDRLVGGTAHDKLYGGPGDDYLDGRDGNDYLAGHAGKDVMYGGAGNDQMHGGADDDIMYGGAGNDWMYGHGGNDVMHGGADTDRMYGGPGDDILYGDSGNDFLYGGDGDDRLYGGDGIDRLYGEKGNDGLFGGGFSSKNLLVGGPGKNRYLVYGPDVIEGRTGADARIDFINRSSVWTNKEIESIDAGLHMLHKQTRNVRLLIDRVSNHDLPFIKVSSIAGGVAQNVLNETIRRTYNSATGQWTTTVTYRRELLFAEWNENDAYRNSFQPYIVIHELAHNWDDKASLNKQFPNTGYIWDRFLTRSRWVKTRPNNSYVLSGDGEWWYLGTSQFAASYGRLNPYEDWATVWEHYFRVGGPAGQPAGNLRDKLADIDLLFRTISS